MNIQNEPLFDIASNLSALLLQEVRALKHAILGWPDQKWIQVEGNRPSIFFVDVNESGHHAVSQYDVRRTVKRSDGTGLIVREKMRLRTTLQITLLAATKAERDDVGWQIKQYLINNFRLPILDFKQSTPAPTDEYMLLFFKNDHRESQGEANFWRRDLTFDVQTRVLDAEEAVAVGQATLQQVIDLRAKVSPNLPANTTTASTSSSVDADLNPVDTASTEP